MKDSEILAYFDAANQATVNTEIPEAGAVAVLREMLDAATQELRQENERLRAVKTIILRCTDCNTRLEQIMGTSIPYCPNCKPQHNHVFNLDGSHAVSVCWCSCVHERLNEEGICRSCGADKRGIG